MTINEATSDSHLARFEPVEPPSHPFAPVVPLQPSPSQPGFNPMMRCPMPQITSSPDSLRQFYIGGVVPQTRIIPAKSLTNQ